jgi:hypothetical protein
MEMKIQKLSYTKPQADPPQHGSRQILHNMAQGNNRLDQLQITG